MKQIIRLTLIILVSTGCSQPKPVKTIENLKAAIIGETNASARYEAFAAKAHEEGFETIARLFEATSKAEAIHSANHTRVLAAYGENIGTIRPEFEVKTTVENLRVAIDGETYEANTMYPLFITDAVAEKAEEAQKTFIWAEDTEKKHKQFCTVALEALAANTDDSLSREYALCPVCGNTFGRTAVDDNCSFCQTSNEEFIHL
jgi:rubrerythrin